MDKKISQYFQERVLRIENSFEKVKKIMYSTHTEDFFENEGIKKKKYIEAIEAIVNDEIKKIGSMNA
jgi:hypothetical protein